MVVDAVVGDLEVVDAVAVEFVVAAVAVVPEPN